MGKKFLFLTTVAILFTCCKDKPEDQQVNTDNYDRRAMLSNIGNNVILPAYSDLQESLDSLVIYTGAFNTNPTTVSLYNLRQCLFTGYKNWQYCSAFEFGPAETILLRQSANTFPCDTSQVNSNITSGTWDLSAVSNLDAIGFPALDFLLHGRASDIQLIWEFSSSPNAANRKQYLSDVVADLNSKIAQVNNAWLPSGGDYLTTFINSTSLNVGSSIGYLVNQLNYDYEILKNARIGIPLGKRSLNIPLPEKCEAVYAGYSVELAVEHLRSIENIFYGRSKSGIDGPGLDDYLDYLGATTNGTGLSVAIKSKLDEVETALQNIPGPLSDAVVNNQPPVETAYTKILEGLVLLKTDMPSALGVLITYQDSDGD